ncbi:MAG: hypothetical protein GXO79_08465 [Chlorobi bacterium]|nr:hypothetical protein [Chlorobiota bacterium]
MQIFDFLEDIPFKIKDNNPYSFINIISFLKEIKLTELNSFKLALIGIPEDRNSANSGSMYAPNKVREALFKLKTPVNSLKLVDFGNIKTGVTTNETYNNVKAVLSFCHNANLLPVIIGGSNNLITPVYFSFEKNTSLLNLTSINSNILDEEENYLSDLIFSKNEKLFNYSNIGYQSYYVSEKLLNKLNNFNYNAYRLGNVRKNILDIEPVLRDTNLLDLNINSIKQSDAPGYYLPTPNGFYSDEICQIARFAGLSDCLQAFCLFDFNPEFDRNNQSSMLVAQIIWYFIEGFYNRKIEDPLNDKVNFTKFHVQHDSFNFKLEFLKSNKTGRWWLQLPFNSNLISNNPQFLACSYDDYNQASNNNIPDRIWKFYQKIL